MALVTLGATAAGTTPPAPVDALPAGTTTTTGTTTTGATTTTAVTTTATTTTAAEPTARSEAQPQAQPPRPQTQVQQPEQQAQPEPAAPTKTDVEVAEERVFELTNAERAAQGCPTLAADDRLDAAARAHSADMAAQNYFDHVSRDGRSFVDRVKAAGYPSPGAENIAAGQRTPEAVVKGWMESPGHRANILNCKLKALGVGMARGGSYGIYWTQNFGW
ncbi:CAP domain-containing protein [Saccharothrix syringae]|uniref:CAP domain-containing protein n=2 Tax=Saccharothrix syringae TaxID=103733 RepID=A0A5Q0HDV8_SACSY|nr:CAP domain-containing protein [Saccharothrix syringae]